MAFHEQHERACPHCGERMSATAPKCLNCGRRVDEEDDEEPEGGRSTFFLATGIVVALVVVVLIVILLA